MANNSDKQDMPERVQNNHSRQEQGLMSRMALNDNKAGMEGLNKEKINQIIYNASKGSKFFENERKKEEQLNERIKEQQTMAKNISEDSLREGEFQADLLIAKLLQYRDFSHSIVHVDMDAFYAAVEMRDRPSLRLKPMAVGGTGMLSTSNYLARKFGVRAAMPGFIGLKLCPDLVIVPPNFEKYTAVSQEIRQVLAVYDPNFCPMSLDEAYLDFGPHLQYRSTSPVTARTFVLRLTPEVENDSNNSKTSDSIINGVLCVCDLNCVLLPTLLEELEKLTDDSSPHSDQAWQELTHGYDSAHPPPDIPKMCQECGKHFPNYELKIYGLTIEDAVCEMRNRIEQRTFLTASAGIAPNMMLAKVCSDKNKPNGQYRIPPNERAVEEFVHNLPIRKISGIGKVTEKLLGAIGVVKCSDIQKQRALLFHLFSPTSFQYFVRIYLGMGSTVVQRDDERKSMSIERTFNEVSDKAELCSKCEEMSKTLAEDLKSERMIGKTVTLKIKCVSFEVKTRSQSLQNSTSDPSVISAVSKQLLLTEIKNTHPSPLRLRLMGVRMSKLESEEKKEVTVKDIFKRLKTEKDSKVSTSTCNEDKVLVSDHASGSFLYVNEEAKLRHDQCSNSSSSSITFSKIQEISNSDSKEDDDCIIISKSSSSSTKVLKDMMGGSDSEGKSKPKTLKRGKQKDLHSSSKTIERFLTQKPSAMTCDYNFQDSVNASKPESQSADQKFELPFESVTMQKTVEDTCHRPQFEKSIVPETLSSYESSSNSNSCDDFHHVKISSDSNFEILTCPICDFTEDNWDLNKLNSHVDVCLSQQTIREILNTDRKESDVSFNSAQPSTSTSSSSQRQPSTKRFNSNTGENCQKNGSSHPHKIQRTVISYFQR